ncbi:MULTISPECIES: DUF4251 domain-containing protein [unclassified Carboxylicivirga]|uniref:DUF4251 domain-containing protein n=1 Tax=Carboxylicivirga TaxID=1628153 RepID=UPI003D335ED1
MRLITNITLLMAIALLPLNSAAQKKKDKKERRLEQFAETQKMINNKQFIFVPDRAYPQGGRSIDLTTNYGFIKIMGTESAGDMPFFGRGYSVPYGGDSGIKYEKTSIEKEKTELNEKKMRISYSFEAQGENDRFRIRMDIGYNGGTSVHITSNNRSQISYNGKVSVLDNKKDE